MFLLVQISPAVPNAGPQRLPGGTVGTMPNYHIFPLRKLPPELIDGIPSRVSESPGPDAAFMCKFLFKLS